MRFYRSVNNPLLNCGYMTVKSVQVTIQCHLSHLGSWYSLGLPGRVNCRGKKNHLDYNTVMLLLISNLIIFKIYFLHFRFKIKLIFMSELKHPLPPPPKYHFQHVTLKCHSISELWQVNSFCLNFPMQSRPNPIPTVPPCTRKSPRGWEAGKTLLLHQH